MTAPPTTTPGHMAPAPAGTHRSGRRFPLYTLVALALAWIVPIVTYVLGVAILVPVLVIVATASLLRGGRTLVDRLVFAIAILIGATCAGALVFAVWPFGMHPVAVGATALTGLVVIAHVTKRRPTLPRPAIADLVTLGTAGFITAFAAWPLVRRTENSRMAIFMGAEDSSRHLSLFDGIRHLEGYAFMKWDAAHDLMYGGMVTYPQGQHMITALLDNFWRSSSTEYGEPLSFMDHYLASHALGYGLLGLAMVWAVQWIAAGALTPLRRIVLAGTVSTIVLVGDLIGNLVLNYSSTVVGLAYMVLLVAVLARGVASTRQQMVTIACLVIAVGFTYYLFLPPALLAVFAWLVLSYRRVLRHKIATAVTIVVAAPIALLPTALGVFLANQTDALLMAGELRPSRDHLIALGAAVLGSILFTRGIRHPIWRRYLAALLSCLLFACGLLTYYVRNEGGNSYYSNKALHLVLVVLLIGLGALLLHLPSPRRVRGRDPIGAWIRAIAPGLAAGLVVAGSVGIIRNDAPYEPYHTTTWPKMWWLAQRQNARDAADIRTMLAAGPPPADTAVIVWDVEPVRAYFQTLFLGTFQRTSGRNAPGVYLGASITEPDRLEHQIQGLADPVRIVVLSPEAEAQARQVVARYPGRRVEVVRIGS